MRTAWPLGYRGDVLQHDVAAHLEHAYAWTRAASEVVPAVSQQVAPALTVAAQLYEARLYPIAVRQLAGVDLMVQQARLAYPALPEL